MTDPRTQDTLEWMIYFLAEEGDPYLNGGYDPDLQRFLRHREGVRVGERNREQEPSNDG